MDTQSKEIVKLDKTSSATKSDILGSYFARTVEIISSGDYRRKFTPLIITFIALAVILFTVLIGNINNRYNQPVFQLRRLSPELAVASDYHRQAVLSDYLKTMTRIVLEDNSRQIKAKLSILRALTHSTLQELDPERKRYVVMFLRDANLLQRSSRNQPSLLSGADLAGVDFHGMNFRSVNFQGANLEGSDFRGTDLRKAYLKNANLSNSCYDSFTRFDRNFEQQLAGMREIPESQKCS